eukprot:7601430-Heterocapsa_arctica.AAC.1
MNKLTDSLKEDRGEDNSQTKEHGLHILCKHRSKEEQHDTKWKYIENTDGTHPIRKRFTGAWQRTLSI